MTLAVPAAPAAGPVPRAEALAGGITLAPGDARAPLVRRRPAALMRLLAGRPADQLPEMAAALFTLCGHAHRFTARRAVAAARGLTVPDAPQDRQALRWHAARDQVRRILVDWPAHGAIGGHGAQEEQDTRLRAAAGAALAPCPLLQGGAEAGLQALPQWMETHLLGMPLAAWLEGAATGERWLAAWAEGSATPPARWLHAARPLAGALALHARPLRLHGDAPLQHALAARLGSGAAEAQALDARIAPLARPGWETGAWTRAHDPAPAAVHNAWMRLAARLIDLARLAQDAGAQWLCSGAATTGPHAGLAWTETARGLLAHWVRLDGGRVADCAVVAPTDWNFHPEGRLAPVLAGLPADARGAAQAGLLALAFDACVPVRIAVREGAADA